MLSPAQQIKNLKTKIDKDTARIDKRVVRYLRIQKHKEKGNHHLASW